MLQFHLAAAQNTLQFLGRGSAARSVPGWLGPTTSRHWPLVGGHAQIQAVESLMLQRHQGCLAGVCSSLDVPKQVAVSKCGTRMDASRDELRVASLMEWEQPQENKNKTK